MNHPIEIVIKIRDYDARTKYLKMVLEKLRETKKFNVEGFLNKLNEM
ncbi:hypothetical protein J5U23_00386 [Saccharolobus shibatae B12]|uniref:Uncharacterized protein n=2 Tax=Saccharolobus shibatae TaxID=2286 RepID=A0A8F5BT45_9CREN|nr:hypothetical protein J5U23_00386 [Saccharolobus shibatae B12]QXJ30833.1 hypothetical protein J5U21_00482 [Saccharolobus shibatae]QXJ33869.1 hypothetical protein J5U22_00414 [Saccharolobus shibatae]